MTLHPQELAGRFFPLSVVEVHSMSGVAALASWDSSIHDSLHLNRITATTERAYLIVKVVVRLSHPAAMDLVLRKRLCFTVVKRHSLTEKLKRRLGQAASVRAVAVSYEIVSNVPKASAELEDRESLAVAAASGQELDAGDGETFIERYSKGVSAVETILLVDRLRQQVAVKEKLSQGGKKEAIRKTMSVPNFVQMSQSLSFDNLSATQMRSSASFQVTLPPHLSSPPHFLSVLQTVNFKGSWQSIIPSQRHRFPIVLAAPRATRTNEQQQERAGANPPQEGGELSVRRRLGEQGMSRSFTLETVPECEAGDGDSLARWAALPTTSARPTFLNLGLGGPGQGQGQGQGRVSPGGRRHARQG